MSTANKAALTTPALDPQPLTLPFSAGDVIADKYKVVSLLGAGGVAYVISAVHLELGELVALKFLRPESLAHEEVVARFASEARAVARIKSEHVAHVFDVGTLPDGAPFIVMEYLDGKNLAEVLHEHGRLSAKVAVDYVLQACEALACAHAAGIVHRDIKPENLFLTQSAGSVEVVKVLDFGISKSALAAAEPGGRRYAHTMLPMGTPGYMSPEQIRACGTVDARTDVWALGCVLSELMTGQCVFDAPTLLQLSATILERDPLPLRKILPEAPPELEALIQKCLDKNVDNRFQDVAELAIALYPFGPRRSRISAERCYHVLRGQQGTVIEFGSVAPPAISGTMPVSRSGAALSAGPISVTAIDPLQLSTPTSITLSGAFTRTRAKKRFLVVTVIAGIAAAVGALAFWPSDATDPILPPTPSVVGAPTPQARPVVEPRATPVAQSPEAPAATPPRSSAQKAKAARAQRNAAAQAARQAPAAAKPRPPVQKRRTSVAESEPDVGY